MCNIIELHVPGMLRYKCLYCRALEPIVADVHLSSRRASWSVLPVDYRGITAIFTRRMARGLVSRRQEPNGSGRPSNAPEGGGMRD